MDTGHCSVAQAGLDFTSHLELTVDAPAAAIGVLYRALSGHGFLTGTFQTDCETHLGPGEMNSVSHS